MSRGFRHGIGFPGLACLLHRPDDVLQTLAGEQLVLGADAAGLVEDIRRIALLQPQHHVARPVVVLWRTQRARVGEHRFKQPQQRF